MNPIAKLGNYDIYEKLGEGGLAKVFLARDSRPNADRRFIALKCLSKEAEAMPHTNASFFNEIKLLENLSHPNLLHGEESGLDQGVHYFVTEFIDGQDLRAVNHRIQKGASIISLIPFVISEILRGLAYLHDINEPKLKNILHNDLTPGNIFLGYEGEVKILDFGAATFKGQKAVTLDDNAVLGTLSYLAPEKLMGKTTDYTADLYAVGILLYELAFGAPPYRHREGESDMDVLNRIVQGRYEPLQNHNKPIPDTILSTIETAMHLKPKKRFKNAQEMALNLGIDLSIPVNKETQNRRRFLLGSAVKSLFPREYEQTAQRRQ